MRCLVFQCVIAHCLIGAWARATPGGAGSGRMAECAPGQRRSAARRPLASSCANESARPRGGGLSLASNLEPLRRSTEPSCSRGRCPHGTRRYAGAGMARHRGPLVAGLPAENRRPGLARPGRGIAAGDHEGCAGTGGEQVEMPQLHALRRGLRRGGCGVAGLRWCRCCRRGRERLATGTAGRQQREGRKASNSEHGDRPSCAPGARTRSH